MDKVRPAQAIIRPWSAYLLVALVAFIVFLPRIQDYFLGDDWMEIARNSGRPLPAPLKAINDSANSRGYRPLSESPLAWPWPLFGLNPIGYHAIGFALHALNSVLVSLLGQRLARDHRVGLLAGLLFAVLACHTEAVLFLSARNDPEAAAFGLLSILSYIRFRDGGRRAWWIGALALYIVSLLFKETILAVPFLMALYDLIFVLPSNNDRSWRWRISRMLPSLPMITLGGAYLLFRLQVGGGYAVPLNVLALPKNLVYYLLMETAALPASTHFLYRFPLATLPVITMLSIACAVSIGLACKQVMRNRVVWFGAIWMVSALSPVIMILTERTTYFSSVGWAWAIGAMLVLAWDATSRLVSDRRWLTAFAIAAILGANLVTLTHRSYWWNHAAEVSRDVYSQLQSALADLPQGRGSQLWLVNPPGHIEYADAMGDRLLFAVWLLQGQLGIDFEVVLVQGRTVNVSPSEDMRQLLSAQATQGPVVALYWQGENLTQLSIPEASQSP